MSRWNRVEDVFSFQRDMDRLFNDFWSDLPSRTATSELPASFRANATDDGWQIDIPIPGIDPKDVTLDVAGNTLSIRAEASGDMGSRYEQSFTIPQFLDLEKLSATHRHGMLRLTVPLKESLKPRRIKIETQDEGQKQLVSR